MKRSLVKLVSLSYLMVAANFMAISCSSSDEGADGEEVVSEDGNEAADAEGNAAANEEGGNANVANNEEGAEGGNNFGNEGNQAATNEFGNGAEGTAAGDNLAGAEAAAPAGDDAVNQIIEEMNNTGAADAAAAAPAAEGTENLAANAAPTEGNAAAVPADATAQAPAAAPSAPAAPGLPELGSKMVYIVQKGDTLAKIAQRVYGDMNKWTEIADFTGIANPNLVYPGDVVYYQLTETTQAFASSYEAVVRSEVEVGQGDTLATISSRVLGNSTLWKLIWRQNDKIANPDRLEAGTKIYYIDSAKLAALDKEVSVKFASLKVSKEVKKVVKAEVSKVKSSVKAEVSKSLEVSNDKTIDSFTTVNSQNLVARLI